MELKEFIASFTEIFDETESSLINENTIFQDLDEWSSLSVLGVIALVKSEYGKEISNSEIKSCNTIGELFDVVRSK